MAKKQPRIPADEDRVDVVLSDGSKETYDLPTASDPMCVKWYSVGVTIRSSPDTAYGDSPFNVNRK
jgi:hypothetical protein